MKQIKNPWWATGQQKYYDVGEPCFTCGDVAIYEQSSVCFLYTIKDKAVKQLAGKNKDFAVALSNRTRPKCGGCISYSFDRAISGYNKQVSKRKQLTVNQEA